MQRYERHTMPFQGLVFTCVHRPFSEFSGLVDFSTCTIHSAVPRLKMYLSDD